MHTLTFQANIGILNVFDKNGNCVVYNGDDEESKYDETVKLPDSQYFEWKLSAKLDIVNSASGNVLMSKIFMLYGVKWYLMFSPKHASWSSLANIYLGIADFGDIAEISMLVKLNLKDVDEAISYSLQLYCNEYDIASSTMFALS